MEEEEKLIKKLESLFDGIKDQLLILKAETKEEEIIEKKFHELRLNIFDGLKDQSLKPEELRLKIYGLLEDSRQNIFIALRNMPKIKK